MMANSPSCSSTSPTASTASNAMDLQETDAFSDDSGVDVKPQIHIGGYQNFNDIASTELNRRNKRKSSEPKKRKDVLLMKRFRWDTDEEDMREETDDVFDDVLEREERPSSGDSGCQLDTQCKAAEPPKVDKKKRPRQWRKPKVEVNKDDETSIAFRQSVIRKNDNTPCTSTTSNPLPDSRPMKVRTSLVAKIPEAHPSLPEDYDPVNGEEGPRTTSGRNSASRPRNYKSMSPQRRIEANARERTRVHTISAAFESLRRAVPAYAHNQKLSKLAILRIASAYIVALACLNGQGSPEPSLADCVERCTRTIQAEGRSRRRTSKVSLSSEEDPPTREIPIAGLTRNQSCNLSPVP